MPFWRGLRRPRVGRNPAAYAVDVSFVGMENSQSGGVGSDPSRVPTSAERDAEMEVERSRVSKSAAKAGIERSVPVQAKKGVLHAAAAPKLSLVPRLAPPEFWMHGFEIGDMVWGKVKSHPWWPGCIYDVHLAPPSVRQTRKEGHLLVAFFGDSSYGWLVPGELLPFDPYYLEKSKQTTSKIFIVAIGEAQYEESRRAALGLTCRCRNARNFRYFGFPGYVLVDVPGYEQGAEYSLKQIEDARKSFVPEVLLFYLLRLALSPQSKAPFVIDFIRNKARLLAYRRAVFEEYDETYPQAFGVQPLWPSRNDAQIPDQPDYIAPRGFVTPEDGRGEIKKKKKKKKMKRLIDIEADSYRDGGQSYGKLRVGLGLGQIDRMESQKRDDAVMKTSDLHAAAAAAVRQPSVDVSSLNLELPQLLRDLQELAANPFHAIERNAAGVVVQVFGKFRSRVYLKSLRPPASERDVAELQATAVAEPGVGNADMTVRKEAKDQRSEPSSFALKLVKPRPKPDDTRKAGSKRGPSDRQEPSNEKKMKKTTQVNALALGKKVGIGLKKPEGQQRNQKESSTATIKPSVASARAKNKGEETVKKQEPTSPPLPFSPTALLLKFSLETSLPSVAKLKAMLAVFGPLVKDSTRVYWKSHSCRVVYEHKPHAVAALNYARKSDLLLGPLRCYIRELDPATLKLLSSPAKPQSPKSNSSGGPPLGPGNGGDQPRALPYQQQQAPTSQLKSILKKPGGRVGGGGSAGDAAEQHPQPVTFTGNGRDNWEEPPVLVPAASHGNGGISAAGSSFTITCKNPKSAGLLPLPLLPIHSPLSNTPRAMDELRLLPPPPLPPSISAPPTPRAADGPYPSIPLPLPVPPRGADVPFPSISLPLAPPPRAAASLFPSISLPLAPPPRAAAGLFPSISPPPPLVGGLLPPPLPLPCIVDRFEARGRGPAQFKQSQPQHNGQHAGVEEGEKPDISDQMLILLKRCNNIVNHIHSSLGYLPYHPL